MDILTTGCGLIAVWAAGPTLDAFLRWRRLAAVRSSAPGARGRAPGRLLAVIPSRAEGARVGDLAGDLKRESERNVDVLVALDGPDPDAEARLARDGVPCLSRQTPGPSKGHVLAFLAERLGERLDAYEFILVFDADMRLPEGFFRDLRVPEGIEVFQLPVRPAGVPAPGAPRVEALSLAEARLDDRARSAAGLPVRLRGKAMGFTPRAFRLGPAAATRTTAEDSEATLALLARGVAVRALDGPLAFDTPPADAGAMGRSRARWFGGHLKLLLAGFGNVARSFVRQPVGTFVLAADLWLRPRVLLLGTLALLAGASDALMVVLSANGAWAASAPAAGGTAAAGGAAVAARPIALLACLLLLSLQGKLALLFEWFSIVALRRSIGYPSEVPAVLPADLADSVLMWGRAIVRGVTAPGRWHRARPPA